MKQHADKSDSVYGTMDSFKKYLSFSAKQYIVLIDKTQKREG